MVEHLLSMPRLSVQSPKPKKRQRQRKEEGERGREGKREERRNPERGTAVKNTYPSLSLSRKGSLWKRPALPDSRQTEETTRAISRPSEGQKGLRGRSSGNSLGSWGIEG